MKKSIFSSAPSLPTRHVAFFMLAALLLGGCGIPHLADPFVMKPTDTYATAKSFTGNRAAWPEATWWTIYKDPQLDTLVDEALANSPDLAQAESRIRAAQAIVQQANSAFYPGIDANASVQEVKQSYNNGIPAAFIPKGFQEAGRASLDFNYELDFFGRNRAALAAATSEAQAAEATGAQSRLALETSLVATYADLARLYADWDAATESVTIRAKSARLLKERFDNGLENAGSFNQADAERASAEAEVEALNENIALTKNRLAALMGAGPDRGLQINRPKINVTHAFGLPENLPANLLGRRPDIVAARLRAEAAASRVTQAKANFYPNVNLSAYAGLQSLGFNTFTDNSSTIAAFGPAVSLPLFDTGQRRGFFRQSAANYDDAVASYNQSVTRALQDVADVATSERALVLRTTKIRAALNAATKAHQVAQDRYKGGLATYIEVLRAQDSLIGNKRALADIQSRAFTLDVALVRALGGGFMANKGK